VEIRLIFHALRYAESQIQEDTIRNVKPLLDNSQMETERTKCVWSPFVMNILYGVTTPLSFSPRGYLNCSLYTSMNCSKHKVYKSTTCQFGLYVKHASGVLLSPKACDS